MHAQATTGWTALGVPVHLTPPRREILRRFSKRLVGDKLALFAFVVFTLSVAAAVLAPYVAPYDFNAVDLAHRLQGPVWTSGGSWAHVFGTDQLGRDLLTRIMWGGRVSLRIGFVVVTAAGMIGTPLGLMAGLIGGKVEWLIMRMVDVMFAVPGLLVTLVFIMSVGVGERNLIIALTINHWMVSARLVRGLTAAQRDGPLVEAARAVGVRPSRIMVRHVLPTVLAPLLTLFVLEIAGVMLAEAGLSFLGYGIKATSVSWGLIIGQGRNYLVTNPWLVTLPGLFLALTILSLNLVANWLRTEADPLQQHAEAR